MFCWVLPGLSRLNCYSIEAFHPGPVGPFDGFPILLDFMASVFLLCPPGLCLPPRARTFAWAMAAYGYGPAGAEAEAWSGGKRGNTVEFALNHACLPARARARTRSISKIAHCPLELEAMFLPQSGRNWFWSKEFTETTWMDTAHHTQRSNDG